MHLTDVLSPLGWLPLNKKAAISAIPSAYYRQIRAGISPVDADGQIKPHTSWINIPLGEYIPRNLLMAYAFLVESRDHALEQLTTLNETSGGSVVSIEAAITARTIAAGDVLFSHDSRQVLLSITTAPERWAQFSQNLPDSYLYSDWLNSPLIRGLPKHLVEKGLLSDPYELCRYAFGVMLTSAKSVGIESTEFVESLSLFSVALMGIYPRNICQICYRHAVPQELRCRYHSQGKRLLGENGAHDLSRASAAARTGRLISEQLDSRSTYYLPMEISVGADADHGTLASLLWGPAPFLNADVRRRLDLAVEECPHVAKLLPVDFNSLSYKEKIFALQEALDPQEYDVAFWPGKIYIAEEWLTLADEKAPGRLKKSDTTIEMAATIRRLLDQGHSQTEIARKLGISKSYVTRLLRRVPV